MTTGTPGAADGAHDSGQVVILNGVPSQRQDLGRPSHAARARRAMAEPRRGRGGAAGFPTPCVRASASDPGASAPTSRRSASGSTGHSSRPWRPTPGRASTSWSTSDCTSRTRDPSPSSAIARGAWPGSRCSSSGVQCAPDVIWRRRAETWGQDRGTADEALLAAVARWPARGPRLPLRPRGRHIRVERRRVRRTGLRPAARWPTGEAFSALAHR